MVLFGFRIVTFARREITGGVRSPTASGKATCLVGHLVGEFLVGTFRFQFLDEFQMRLPVGSVLSFAIGPEQTEVGDNKESFIHDS